MRCDWGSLEMFVFRRCFWIFLIEYERRGDEVEEKERNITHNLNHIHTVFGEMQIDKNKFCVLHQMQMLQWWRSASLCRNEMKKNILISLNFFLLRTFLHKYFALAQNKLTTFTRRWVLNLISHRLFNRSQGGKKKSSRNARKSNKKRSYFDRQIKLMRRKENCKNCLSRAERSERTMGEQKRKKLEAIKSRLNLHLIYNWSVFWFNYRTSRKIRKTKGRTTSVETWKRGGNK